MVLEVVRLSDVKKYSIFIAAILTIKRIISELLLLNCSLWHEQGTYRNIGLLFQYGTTVVLFLSRDTGLITYWWTFQ